MNKELMEIYTDFLIYSFGLASAVNLSKLTDGKVSHDKITRMLRAEQFTSKELWKYVKTTIRKIESKTGVLVFDDSIEEKPYTDENDIICWHYDHSKNRNVKGINFLTGLYYNSDMSLPVCYEIIKKTESYTDEKTGKLKRKSKETKNEIFRRLLRNCVKNGLVFGYVLFDSWYSSAENMEFTKIELLKDFISAIKSNRKVALSKEDKLKGKWVTIESLKIEKNEPIEIFLEGVSIPLLYVRQIFTNDDGSNGILHLVTSDLTLTYDSITTIYKKRWKVEEFHKSLKQNASLEKSPTKTVKTQSNHFFASMCAFVKLEITKSKTKLNQFAIKNKLYIAAIKESRNHLYRLSGTFA